MAGQAIHSLIQSTDARQRTIAQPGAEDWPGQVARLTLLVAEVIAE
jgi:hypothetical protein